MEELFSILGQKGDRLELLSSSKSEEGLESYLKIAVEQSDPIADWDVFYKVLTTAREGVPAFKVVNNSEVFQAYDKKGKKISADIKKLL